MPTHRSSLIPVALVALVVGLVAGSIAWSFRSHNSSDPKPNPTSDIAADTGVEGQPASPLPAEHAHAAAIEQFKRNANAMVAANNASGLKIVAAGTQKLRSRYDNEPVDRPWALRKQKALADANESPMLDDVKAKPLSFDSNCRSTTCLISANFPSASEAEDWFTLYTMLAGPEMSNAAMERTTNPDGTVHLQIYGQARK